MDKNQSSINDPGPADRPDLGLCWPPASGPSDAVHSEHVANLPTVKQPHTVLAYTSESMLVIAVVPAGSVLLLSRSHWSDVGSCWSVVVKPA